MEQNLRVSKGQSPDQLVWDPWSLAQSNHRTDDCLLIDWDDEGQVTTQSFSESGGEKQGREKRPRDLDALLFQVPETGHPYPRGMMGGPDTLPAGHRPSAQGLAPQAGRWKSAGHWLGWLGKVGRSGTAPHAAGRAGSGCARSGSCGDNRGTGFTHGGAVTLCHPRSRFPTPPHPPPAPEECSLSGCLLAGSEKTKLP